MIAQDKVLKTKLNLLELGKQLVNVSQTCKIMGILATAITDLKNFVILMEMKALKI